MGMFVVHRFEVKDVLRWNEECTDDEYKKPKSFISESVVTVNECDFIIFHHTLGVILLEVENDSNIREHVVQEAEAQLQASQDIIARLAAFNRSEKGSSFPHRKVIAMPSTKKSEFNRDRFSSLSDDTLLLFSEYTKDIESFQQWWKKNLEEPDQMAVRKSNQEAYKQALSFTLMIRHLGPVTAENIKAYVHESLMSQKYGKETYLQVLQRSFPNVWSWCKDVLAKVDQTLYLREGNTEQLLKTFLNTYNINARELRGQKGLEILNRILEHSKYVGGSMPSALDEAIAILFSNEYFLFFENIVQFYVHMRQELDHMEEIGAAAEKSAQLNEFPFLQLDSMKDLNELGQHLSRFTFLEGDKPTEVDHRLFKTLTCQFRMKHARLPVVMSSQQLAVYEGPSKQLIIGPPGSGKTELLKFKARELEVRMRACKIDKKILYIIGNGAPNRESLLFYSIKDFFTKSSLVEVITIIIDTKYVEQTNSKIRQRIDSGDYEHVFIDEYWIGAKEVEQEVILELISKIPGYVWISSVFNYRNDSLETNDKLRLRTKPLLKALEHKGGQVSYITQVLRTTNSIIDFEREYGGLYQDRSYPYGTKEVLNHTLTGLPIQWVVEKDLNSMYIRCAEVVNTAIRSTDANGEKLALDPTDIVIVNFAVRMNESLHNTPLDELLRSKNIRSWNLNTDNPDKLMSCDVGKVTLLQSYTRQDSSYLDGVEWPMVVVILPSSLLLGTAPLANGAPSLRNYDTYIAMFRAMVKLVVISDKWTHQAEFLADIVQKK